MAEGTKLWLFTDSESGSATIAIGENLDEETVRSVTGLFGDDISYIIVDSPETAHELMYNPVKLKEYLAEHM